MQRSREIAIKSAAGPQANLIQFSKQIRVMPRTRQPNKHK